MRHANRFRAAIVSVVIASGGVIVATEGQKSDKGIETFDTVWRLVNETYFDAHFNGADWTRIRETFRPRAERASTVAELRSVIQEMLSLVGGSHLQLLPADIVDGPTPTPAGSTVLPSSSPVVMDGDLGMDVRALDGRVLVTRVDPSQSADRAGVKPGWVLSTMDGLPFQGRGGADRRKSDASITARAQRRFVGPAGSRVQIEFRDGTDQTVTRQLERRARAGRMVKLDNLPEEYVVVTHEWLPSPAGTRIGVIAFNSWAAPVVEQFASAIQALSEADGLIIDLRGNAGGIAQLIPAIASHFFDHPVVLGTWIHRGGEIPIKTDSRPHTPQNPGRAAFHGRIAILIDGLSHSATELFAAGMQSVGRGRVFGEVSYGGAIGAVYTRLPNGDVLEHAVVQFVTAKGETFDGRGVVPDQPVALSRESLIAGEDAVLLAARKWIETPGHRAPREHARPRVRS